jgi:uncharacterized protein YbjT (DUF2867 family)
MKVLTYGATGVQGAPVARRLLESDHEVRVLVRDPSQAGSLSAAGAEVVAGNLDDRDSIFAATSGVDAVFFHLPLVFDRDTGISYARNVIDAASEAGVQLLVYNTSGPVPSEATGILHYDLKRDIESYCREVGLPTIVLRPIGIYMEVLHETGVHASMANRGTLAYPTPAAHRVSWITVEDLAAMAVAALERPDLAGSAFEVGGPDPLTGDELAEKLSAALGYPITYCPVPSKEFAEGLRSVVGDQVAGIVGDSFHLVEESPPDYLAVENAEAIAGEFGVKLTPIDDWAATRDWMSRAADSSR